MSKVLVQEMKAVFVELGVPNVIVSDGGPQYKSAEFKDFTKHWQIEHRVSSPRNPQFNGMEERCVQTMKASLIKTIEEGEDVDLALLTYKTTPLNHRLPLPAELLNSRKYKTLLSTRIVQDCKKVTDKSWTKESKYRHNCTTRTLECCQDSSSLRKLWFKSIQTKISGLQQRSSSAQPMKAHCSLRTIHGGVYTRNRRFIKPDLTEAVLPKPRPEPETEPRMARPTRTIRKPDRLIESK